MIDRSKYPDKTRSIRAGRREALLNIAAHRLGVDSWSKLESEFRKAVETGKTNKEINDNLRFLLQSALTLIDEGTDDLPDDLIAALGEFPARKPGRPITK